MVGEDVDYGLTFRALKEGDVIKAKIVHIDREGVLVDVGTKSEGLVPPQELSRGIPGATESPLAVGDTIDVYVIEAEDQEGNPVLSKKRADFEKAWEHVLQAKNEGEILTAMVTDRVKGGLVVDLGIRGFIPASHVGNGRVRNLEQYIAQALPLKVIEVDKERRKVVLSHRLATEEEREKQREETINTLGENQVRSGVVRRITDYGAFVDLGGIDGLLHISEMSWTRIKHPSEVVKVGDTIQVMVLKVNLDQNRVSLGLRQILPDPWTEVAARYNPGDVVTGTVSRLVPFGAFVQLDGGIEGIIPNSELSSKRVNKPEQVVKVGDEVEVKVKDIEQEQRRIVLSRREVESVKEQEQFQQFTRERQQQPSRERDQARFTIGDALAGQLAGLEEGGAVRAETPEPEAHAQDLTETVETLAASPVEAPEDAVTADPGHGIQAEGAEAPASPAAAPIADDATATTLVSEAEADAALAEESVPDQSTSPEGFARADQVAADAGGSEEASREPSTPGGGGSAFLESDAEPAAESEEEARNA
jgi:4-hydroxy-3-methylbut-2-enyl diphosphate reductase